MNQLLRLACCVLLMANIGTHALAQKNKTAKPTKTELQTQQKQTAAARKKSQAQEKQLNRDIRAALDTALILENQIADQQHAIDSLNAQIDSLQTKIKDLEEQMALLQQQLAEKKARYARALVDMQRHRKLQNKLLFIFSAKNFDQMLRRLRYTNEYSAFLRAQGQMIKRQQAETLRKQNELLTAKAKVETHRVAVEERMAQLEASKQAQERQAAYLKKNLKTVQKQIKEYQRQEAELNKQIDRIIKEEIAEAKRKAEEERRRREEAARQAANASTAAEKSAARTTERALAAAAEAEEKLQANFAANKGKLPMPVTGAYNVVGHYGRYTVSGLEHVQLDNKGIDIRAQEGAQARAIFDGTVSGVYQLGGTHVVLIRHGDYISVYSGIETPTVAKGDKVSTKQTLGPLAGDSNGKPSLHFQLRRQSERLNPELWLRR